jgi:TolA-binding protein
VIVRAFVNGHQRSGGRRPPASRRFAATVTFGVVVLAIASTGGGPAQDAGLQAQAEDVRLAATTHPPVPDDPSHYWVVPDPQALQVQAADNRSAAGDTPEARFVRGAGLIATGRFAEGFPLISTTQLARSPLADYARFYSGVALIGLLRYAEAEAVLAVAAAREPQGALREAIALRLAEAALAQGKPDRAKEVLQALSTEPLSTADEVLLQLGVAEEALGHADHALHTYRRVYYEFPLSSHAERAREGIARLDPTPAVRPDRFEVELTRAERLFDARRWTEARAAFSPLVTLAQGADRVYVALRLAQCEHHLNRHQAARDLLRPHLKDPRWAAEARYVYLTSTRAQRQHATYVTLARQLVADYPESSWAAETLNDLASHFIVTGDEAQADTVLRELYGRFPTHRHAERAAWRVGWRSYKNRNFAEAAQLFEQAAAAFPRSDYRPAWLYWSGRARDEQDDRGAANARYQLTVADYQNLYHGRLASKLLEARQQAPPPRTVSLAGVVAPTTQVRTAGLIRELAAVQLYDDALREVHYARRMWGDSPQLQATVAWLQHHQARGLTATERFTALRGAITRCGERIRSSWPQAGKHCRPRCCGSSFRSTTGRSSRSTPAPTGSTRT